MSASPSRHHALVQSWTHNAQGWTQAVRSGSIQSRVAVTDQAMVDALVQVTPRRVLDLGCGEGWLARRIAATGAEVTGVDASAPLIQAATAAGGATFLQGRYDDLVEQPSLAAGPYEAIACNFALLHEDLGPLLRALRTRLVPAGHLVIQTLHPASQPGPYQDGWREETFEAFPSTEAAPPWAPMPWYFRTIRSWLQALRAASFQLVDLQEPLHPDTARPASLLITCSVQARPVS
ncbi:MAG: methyltransferase domain-containing protein [Bacteroidota bacterium]